MIAARRPFGIALLVLSLSLVCLAQTGNQGSIEGTVSDPSGAVIPGASVTVRNEATNVSFSATTDSSGFFRFPVLPVGSYEVKVEATGFAPVVRKEVGVTVGARVNLPISLSVAAGQEEVVVTGEVPILEPTRSSQAATVTDLAVANLPVNGRNFIDFVLLTPGVTLDVRGGDISFAGQRGTLNSLVVDGADNNNTFFGQTLGRTGSGRAPYQFSQESVQEFQVNSNAYSAEYGRAGGAVINVITKSGTNDYHGSVFWFYRDRAMNANNLINKTAGREKSPFHINQFGASVGGPIVRDKLFFFFNYDGQRQTLPNFVDFDRSRYAVSADPVIAGFQNTALDYLEDRSDSWNQARDQDGYLVKVDWNINPKNILSGRWNNQRFDGIGFERSGINNAEEHSGSSLVDTDTISFSLTTTFSPTVVNVGRFGYVRDKEPGTANTPDPEADIFNATAESALTPAQSQRVLTIGRNFFSPRETTIKRFQWGDTLTWIRGSHTLKFGVDFIRDDIFNFFPGNFSGSYRFDSLEAFGRSLSGQTGVGTRFVQAFAGSGTSGPITGPDIFEVSWFVQDEWRASPTLSFTFGLRYDYQDITQPSVLNPAPSLAAAGIRTDFINQDKNNFGPRFGFAWSPVTRIPMVVRGGYGIYYGRTPSIMVGTAHSNNGLNVQTLTFTGADIPSFPNTICGAPVDSPSCSAPAFGASSNPIIFIFDPDYVEPYIQQGSLGVDFELARDLGFSVNYLVVKGTHLQRTTDINLAPPTPATIGIAGTSTTLDYLRFSSPRPIAGFNRIATFQSSANSIYHGLTAQLNKRFANNYQLVAAYTYGHVIDDVPDATSVVPFTFDDAKVVQNHLNFRDDRASGVNDQRHRLVVSGIWQLNYVPSDASAVVRGILGGWELSGIFTAQSGQTLTGLVSFDLNNDGNNQSDRTPEQGRSVFNLPKIVSLDPRVTRNVRLGERVNLQFIAEAFNVFNRANITVVRTAAFAVSGGVLVPQSNFAAPTVANERILQLAIKVNF